MKTKTLTRILSTLLAVMFVLTMVSGTFVSADIAADQEANPGVNFTTDEVNSTPGVKKGNIQTLAPLAEVYPEDGGDQLYACLDGMEMSAYMMLRQGRTPSGALVLIPTEEFKDFFAGIKEKIDVKTFAELLDEAKTTAKKDATAGELCTTFEEYAATETGKKFYVYYDSDSNTLKVGSVSAAEEVPTNAIQLHGTLNYDKNYMEAYLLSIILDDTDYDYDGDKITREGPYNSHNNITFSEWAREYIVNYQKVHPSDAQAFQTNDSVFKGTVKTLKKAEDASAEYITHSHAGEAPDPDNTHFFKERDTVVFEDIPAGYYVLLTDKVPDGVAGVKTSMKLVSDEDNVPETPLDVTATLKADVQTIEKTVANTDRKKEDGSPEDPSDHTSADVGDILDYDVKFVLPDLAEYTKAGENEIKNQQNPNEPAKAVGFTFDFTDTLHNQKLVTYKSSNESGNTEYVPGLDPVDENNQGAFEIEFSYVDTDGLFGDKNKVYKSKVYVDKPGPLSLSSQAELNSILKEEIVDVLDKNLTYGIYNEGTNTQSFEIRFDILKIKENVKLYPVEADGTHYNEEQAIDIVGKKLTINVRYKAELTDDAQLENENEVTIEFSNDPHNMEPKPYKDDTITYAYGMDIAKDFSDGLIDLGKDGNVKNVEFKLYPKTDIAGNPVKDVNKIVDIDTIDDPGEQTTARSTGKDSKGNQVVESLKFVNMYKYMSEDVDASVPGRVADQVVDGIYVLADADDIANHASDIVDVFKLFWDTTLKGNPNYDAAAGTGDPFTFDKIKDLLSKTGEDFDITKLLTKLIIYGLDTGDYILVETKVPEGYSKPENIDVHIEANDAGSPATPPTLSGKAKEGSTDLTVTTKGVTKQVSDGHEGTITLNQRLSIAFNVLNQRGFGLPSTGGMGTWLLTIGGILLIAAAVSLLVLRKKSDGKASR